jgi:protein involved in polysaccharide export with SLBB domain
MGADRPGSVPLLSAAGALLAVGCCAGLPLLGSVLGGLTIAALVGAAGGVLLTAGVAAGAVLLIRGRRRRACASPKEEVLR